MPHRLNKRKLLTKNVVRKCYNKEVSFYIFDDNCIVSLSKKNFKITKKLHMLIWYFYNVKISGYMSSYMWNVRCTFSFIVCITIRPYH